MPFLQVINSQSLIDILSEDESQKRTNESVFDTGEYRCDSPATLFEITGTTLYFWKLKQFIRMWLYQLKCCCTGAPGSRLVKM
jgi:hypothetical protein